MNTKHLKAKILDLAIRGKLVPQDSSEGNAADLLQKIREEKSELVKQKKIKEDKNASFIIKADDGKHYEQFTDGNLKDIEDEIPFEIPENWCWCRLKDVCDVLMGQSPDGNSVSEKFEGMEFHQGKIYFSDKYLSTSKIKTKEITHIAKENSILLCVRAPVGTANITTRQICIGRGLCAIKPYYEVDIAFWFYWIISQKSSFEMQATGTTFKAVTVDVVRNQLLPLPPLSEQKRIVSAIEKAFEQIDIIEKNKLNLKTYIKQTKSKVMDLAIHGKLVEQNPQEGNAFELLEKIRNEKAELIKQKKLKEDKNASFIIKADDGKHYEQFADGRLKYIEDEIPFGIPENWCWCRLETIFDFIGGGTPDKSKKEYWNGNIPWTSVKDVKGDYLNKTLDTITELGLEAGSNLCHKDEIILVTRISPGKAIISNIETAINQDLKVARLKCELNKHYLQKCFTFFENQMHHDASGSTVKGVKLEYLNSFLFPLPPLSEQKRIVAKIEQVFEQLDVLEKSMGE